MTIEKLAPYLPWLLLFSFLCLIVAIICRIRYERQRKKICNVEKELAYSLKTQAVQFNNGYTHGQRDLLSTILPAEALSKLNSALEDFQFTLQGEFTITGEKIEFK